MKARKEQKILFCPPTQTYKRYVTENLIANPKVTIDYVNKFNIIWSEPEPLVNGNMVRPKPPPVGKIKRIPPHFQ